MIDLANRLAGLLQDGQRLLLPWWTVQRIDAAPGAERTPEPKRSAPAAGYRPPVAVPAELSGETELVGHSATA